MLLKTITRGASLSTRAFQRSFSATAASMRNQYVVVIHDKEGPDTYDRRLAVRPTHLVGAKKLKQDGTIQLGGAILTDHSEAGKMCGSVMIVQANSVEDAKKIIESDTYFTSGVWDKYTVYPFRQATLEP
ncbi:hypothetical protein B0O80DRAFT_532988 [Mortierella sp. GBAus27b]|nr:hypothetical protein BGX31_006616 [Mortierella sp. GBA43]KAI8347401.1 hypothetical protein B0O80DRAFT_532988 [Mortierella sp. GBAus27b]